VLRLPGESEDAVAIAEPEAQTKGASPSPAPKAAAPAGAVQAPAAPRAAAQSAAAPAQVHMPAPVAGPRVQPPLVEDDGRLRATPRARRMAEEKSIDLAEITGTGPGGAIVVADLEAYLAELNGAGAEADGTRATPLALRMASDAGTDLEGVKGSGPGGRITKSDLLEHWKREKSASKEREAVLFRGALQLSQKRKALIRNMVRSKAEAPHFYVEMDVSTDALRGLRDQANRDAGDKRVRLTYTHLMIKAARSPREVPDGECDLPRGRERHRAMFDAINIGLAVDVQGRAGRAHGRTARASPSGSSPRWRTR
jgi:pyruvate dehydrogenase E2 component (dihydrolipoamide acetyltransferase)